MDSFAGTSLLTSAGLAGILVVLGIYLWRTTNKTHRFPPGPHALPIIGNIHQLPREYQEKKFFEWRKEYGKLQTYYRVTTF